MQVINLYPKNLKPKIQLISFNYLMLSCMIFIVAYFCIYLYAKKQVDSLYSDVVYFESLEDDKRDSIESLRGSISFPDNFDDEVGLLEESINKKNKYIIGLKKELSNLNYSYSSILHSIAKNIDSSMYISEVNIKNGTEYLEIKGKSKSDYKIAMYIARMKSEKDLENTNFILSKIKSKDGVYDFVIGSKNVK